VGVAADLRSRADRFQQALRGGCSAGQAFDTEIGPIAQAGCKLHPGVVRKLPAYVRDAPVNIIGAYIPAVDVSNAVVGTLRIDDSYIDDHLSLSNVTILRSVEIHRSIVDTVRLTLVAGGKVTLHETSVKTFAASQLNIGRLSFNEVHIDQLGVSISRFSEQLSIMGGAFDEVRLTESKSDGLFIRPTSLRALKISDYVDSASSFLGVIDGPASPRSMSAP
jgi:hypothetical protein